MAQIPARFQDQPELVAQVIEARQVQMDTEDTAFAIEWLTQSSGMSLASATRALENETFQYVALYPPGHPGLEALRAEQRARSRRSYAMQKLRPQIIDRDDSRCQNCNKRVQGRDASIDHKDPEGPATLENLHLLCRACNTLKGKRTWDEFQQAEQQWRAGLERKQNARPDIICKQTGLSIKGRSWKESGCLTPDLCPHAGECDNGEYAKWAKERDDWLENVENIYAQEASQEGKIALN